MDDPDIGVAMSVTSLVIALLQDSPERYKGSYVKAARRLKSIVVDNDCPADYIYYKVPCPWIQVKFLKLLQYYPPSGKIFSSVQYVQMLTYIQRTLTFAN
jgi:AP-2 complex subunit alpha